MRYYRILLPLLLALLTAPSLSRSQDRGFGAGIIVGEPTGLSGKGWLSSTTAFDAALAWSFARETSFHIHVDYLIHDFDVFTTEEKIPLYYGIGGRIKTGRSDEGRLGIRMVGGVAYLLRDAPIDIFFEIAPILDLTPSTDFRLNAGLGARYFFNK